ncbi:MAG: NADP-dependent oxidoreductase [Mariniphaga sp.]
MKSKIIYFDKRPVGMPEPDNFRQEEVIIKAPADGELLLKTHYISVDPYLRGRMREGKSYAKRFNPGEPMRSGVIAEVVESYNPSFSKGDYVNGMLQWAEYQTSNGEGLLKVDPDVAPLSAYLGILGMPGLTAYLGLMEIGRPQSGETLVVSGAAGAVGIVAGQIGKILECQVIGIAGSDEKTEMLKNDFGFDEAINYKTSSGIRKEIAEKYPSGVDIYFDNVGGEISDSVILNINRFARVIICGAISQYNETRMPTGPRLQSVLLVNSALMKGFLVNDYAEKFPHALGQLTHWLLEGKIKNQETIIEGLGRTPEAFIGLFNGTNKGKMVVKV